MDVAVAAVPEASLAATVMAAGAETMGPVVSTTVTVAEAVAELLLLSRIVKVTVVSPTAKVVGASVVTLELTSPSMLSEAVAPVRKEAIVVLVAAVPVDPSASTEIADGAVISGST